jgi:hypothetical protein
MVIRVATIFVNIGDLQLPVFHLAGMRASFWASPPW